VIARYRVRIPSPLRSYTLGHGEVDVTLPELSPDAAPPLRAIIAALDSSFPGIRFRMIDEQDRVRPHMRIFVNGEQEFSLKRPLNPDDEISIVQALSGG